MADPKKRPIQSDPGLSDLEINKGFGDLEIRWSGFRRKSPRHFSMNVRAFVGPWIRGSPSNGRFWRKAVIAMANLDFAGFHCLDLTQTFP
jgi:hypothetical protein